MNQSPSMASVLDALRASVTSNLWTALPARVESYDAATQTCTAQPLVQNVYYDENEERRAEDLPICADVPVCFPGAGSIAITWPLAPGDVVLLMYASCSLDRWLAGDGRSVDPIDERRNHLSDAIAIPGLRPRGAALAHAATSGVTIAADVVRLGGHDASDPVVRKSDLDAVVARLNSHTHPVPGVTTGSGATTSSAPGGSFNTPACSPVVRSK